MIFSNLKQFFGGRSRYESAVNSSAREAVTGTPGDAEQELSDSARLAILHKARQAAVNEGLIREIVETFDIYSVGDGITPQSASADSASNEAYDEYFSRWARRPVDATGRFNLTKCLSIALRALLIDGEIFIIKTLNEATLRPELFFIEAHRCADTSKEADLGWHQGILFKNGKPAKYRFKLNNDNTRDYDAQHVIHVFDAKRATDVHGVSPFQHALRDVQDAKELLALVKQKGKLQESIAISLQSDRAVSQGNTAGLLDIGTGSKPADRTDPALLHRITGAKAFVLQQGEAAESFAGNSPSPEFFEAYKNLHKAGIAGLLPYEFVIDPSAVGGAGVRLVVGKAARCFDRMQSVLIDTFLVPVRNFVIGQAITAGKLPPAEDWTECEWATPKSVTVDAGRDHAADLADVQNGLITATDFCAVRGRSLARDMAIWKREQAMFREAGHPLAVNSEPGTRN
ncbi:MAG: phage portal protein [Verrucomicrobia bacterium]|nr:phage portal protein [Verrucomicrobiota bacterium]